MLDRAQHRVRRQPAQRAQRSVQQQFTKIVQDLQVLRAVLVGDDPVDHLHTARRADAAGRALAAALDGAEFHGEAGLPREIHRVVEHHDAAVADQTPFRRERFVIERRVEQRIREVRSQRSADLHRAERASRKCPAAEIVDRFAQRDSERFFHQAAVLDVARELDGQRAARLAHAEILVILGALVENDRHRGQRDDVVDHGRLAEQALDGRQRRLGTDLAALAFQAFEQRSFLAANVGARAQANIQIELFAAARDVLAQVALFVGDGDGALHRLERVRIFRAQIDVAAGGAHRESRDGHALDEHERIAFHDHAVGVGAAVAFVRVADDVFLVGSGLQNRLPLDAGGETRAAAPAQSGVGDFVDERFGRHRQRALQAFVTVAAHVIGERKRIDDAAAGEGQPLLLFQIRDLFGGSRDRGRAVLPSRKPASNRPATASAVTGP